MSTNQPPKAGLPGVRTSASDAVAFLPSDVRLVSPLPLIDTMKRCEREIAAALIVRACQFHGDAWQAVTPKMLGEMLKSDLAEKREPLASLNTNPFARPDFHDLVREGYATCAFETGSPLELTPKGFAAIEKWVCR